MCVSGVAMGQETDDMYFNAKDRVQVNAANEVALAHQYQQQDMNAVKTNPVNPSDSYSGRGVNPEFNSQAKNGTSVVQNNPDYFKAGYQPNVNSSLYKSGSNTSYPYYGNSSYNNPCCGYGMNSMYGMGGMYGMGSMYGMGYGMGSMYGMGYGMGSMYGMGGYIPFYSPFGYGMGYSPYSSMFMGYGMSYGMSSMYGMGYSMFGMGMPFYNPYSYYGTGYYGAGTAIDASSSVYGRHPSRSSSLNNFVDNGRNDQTIVGTNGRSREGGRMRTDSQPNYYDRSWRSDPGNFPTRSYYNDNSSGYNRSSWGNTSSGWNSGGRSSFDNNMGGRSSFGGGGMSGGGGGGGGGGGHSRGRN